YHYGVGGGFPTDSFNTTNYWVDVIVSNVTDITPPIVVSHLPASGDPGASPSLPITATFNEAVQPGTILFSLKDSGGNTVPGSVSYNSSTFTVSFTPTSTLNLFATYMASISGTKDVAGNMMSPVTWSFSTAAQSIWPDSVTPVIASLNDPNPVEVGIK